MPNFGCDSELKSVSNDYSNTNTNPKQPSRHLAWP